MYLFAVLTTLLAESDTVEILKQLKEMISIIAYCIVTVGVPWIGLMALRTKKDLKQGMAEVVKETKQSTEVAEKIVQRTQEQTTVLAETAATAIQTAVVANQQREESIQVTKGLMQAVQKTDSGVLRSEAPIIPVASPATIDDSKRT